MPGYFSPPLKISVQGLNRRSSLPIIAERSQDEPRLSITPCPGESIVWPDYQPCCSMARWGKMSLVAAIPFLALLMVATHILSGTRSSLAGNGDKKMLRHVVEFKFKESSPASDIAQVVEAFRALPAKIPAVADFEYGENNSPEGLANGFTHCFLLTFHSESDRDGYLVHPAHQAFVDILKPHLDKVQVLDYWASK